MRWNAKDVGRRAQSDADHDEEDVQLLRGVPATLRRSPRSVRVLLGAACVLAALALLLPWNRLFGSKPWIQRMRRHELAPFQHSNATHTLLHLLSRLSDGSISANAAVRAAVRQAAVSMDAAPPFTADEVAGTWAEPRPSRPLCKKLLADYPRLALHRLATGFLAADVSLFHRWLQSTHPDRRKPVNLVVATASIAPMAANLVLSMRATAPEEEEELAVVCLDKACAALLSDMVQVSAFVLLLDRSQLYSRMGIQSTHTIAEFSSRNYIVTVFSKVLVANLLFRASYTVLLWDADVVWTRNAARRVRHFLSASVPGFVAQAEFEPDGKLGVNTGLYGAAPSSHFRNLTEPSFLRNEAEQAHSIQVNDQPFMDERLGGTKVYLPANEFLTGFLLDRQSDVAVQWEHVHAVHFNWMSGGVKMRRAQDLGMWYLPMSPGKAERVVLEFMQNGTLGSRTWPTCTVVLTFPQCDYP